VATANRTHKKNAFLREVRFDLWETIFFGCERSEHVSN
jgi:hypothetical protein